MRSLPIILCRRVCASLFIRPASGSFAAGFCGRRPPPPTPLGADIAQIFQSRGADAIRAGAKELLKRHGSAINAHDLGDLMVAYGKATKAVKRLKLDDELISLLSVPLGRAPPRVDRGMQILRAAPSPTTEASRRLIGRFADQLCGAQSASMIQISSCFNALLKCEAEPVKAILRALTVHMRRCKVEFGGQAIGNILYGVQRMSSTDEAVREVLFVLGQKMRRSEAVLAAQEIGNALYGCSA
jgi:hypothetical protein